MNNTLLSGLCLLTLATALAVNNVIVTSPATERGRIGQRRFITVDIGLDF
jgi:hypothetical protein